MAAANAFLGEVLGALPDVLDGHKDLARLRIEKHSRRADERPAVALELVRSQVVQELLELGLDPKAPGMRALPPPAIRDLLPGCLLAAHFETAVPPTASPSSRTIAGASLA